ncbi:hypothetical protein VNI00_008231 [Paramarasmius palmivorus]|uniref:Alpha-ketoglutarate-dependent dioxygenase AlkB-like domain-containing protein n=1 Tax=Paramarasmius palmivorus TaxID=297713 RepID=A0AAW0D0J9_9AGAR
MSPVIPNLHDPSSSAYKKAKRQFLKSTKNRDGNVENDWTPFRAAEKRFKAKFPPPDLSNVLDLALLDDQRASEIQSGVWSGRSDAQEWRKVILQNGQKGYILPRIPGLVLLPSFLSPQTQRELVKWSLSEHSRPPNEMNLDTHYALPAEGIWNIALETRRDPSRSVPVLPRYARDGQADPEAVKGGPRTLINNTPASPENFDSLNHVPKLTAAPSPTVEPSTCVDLLPKLRWTNIGWFYHWGTKQYDFTRGKVEVHSLIKDICQDVVKSIDWEAVYSDDTSEWGTQGDWRTWNESYGKRIFRPISLPDAGIVNFYQTKDTLMAHVDRSEVCATSPLVSIS